MGERMMKFSKKMVLSFAAVGTLALLGACGKSNDEASGKTEIEFFNQKKEMQSTLDDIVKDFEKENPTIKVEYVGLPNWGPVWTRVFVPKD